MPRCKICGEKKIIYIDGSWVCDACEVGGISPDVPDKITQAIHDAREEDAEAIIKVCVKKG